MRDVSTYRPKGKLAEFGYANTITLTRIFFIPVFFFILLVDWPRLFDSSGILYQLRPWFAAIVFIVLAASDGVDGYIARSRGEISTFGKFIDPLADKLLITAALLALIEVNVLPAWVAFVIISREFVISGLRMIASAEGVIIAASWYGKIKTLLQIIAVVLFMILSSAWYRSLGIEAQNIYQAIAWLFMGGALVMTVMSMVDYFVNASKVIRGPWSTND